MTVRKQKVVHQHQGGQIADLTESFPSTPDSRKGALSLLCSMVVVFVVVVVAVTVVVVGMFFVFVVIFPCYRLYYLRKKINCKTFYEILHN